MSHPTRILKVAAVLAVTALLARAQTTDVAALAATLVWAQPEEGHRVLGELLKRGAPALKELTALVQAPGQGEDAVARSALNGLALATGSGAAEGERALVSAALLDALQQPADPEVHAFFIAQLNSWVAMRRCRCWLPV